MSIKMKRQIILLFALILVLSSGQTWAQWRHSKADLPYRSFTTFNGDTAAYLEFNYSIRNVQYVGKTVGEILKELEFPALYIVEVGMRSSSGGSPTTVPSLSLGIRQVGQEPNPIKDYYIFLRFENPPSLDKFWESGGRNKVFTPKLYDFIKDLRVICVSSNQFIIKDPEILEGARRVQEENYRKARQIQEELDRRRRSQQ